MEDKKLIQWNEIEGAEDIEKLMNIFGGFHDACLKELYLWTEYYVDQDLSMHIGQEDYRVRILFQREWRNPSAIEMVFENVLELNIRSCPKDYELTIKEAAFIQHNNLFYWADCSDWSPEKSGDGASWISAQKVKWRDVSDWMGPELRYGVKTDE